MEITKGANMKILKESSWIKPDGIRKIEELRNAKYVFESCVKTTDGRWSDLTVAVFYQETAHPNGSNYVGIYQSMDGRIMITDAISATEPFTGVMIDDEIVYSRHRHDFREHNGIFVDGGRDYLRWGGDRFPEATEVNLVVIEDRVEIAT